MSETHEHDGEKYEHFDEDYGENDGTMPVKGLHVATLAEEDDQAIIPAGQWAQVGRRVVAGRKKGPQLVGRSCDRRGTTTSTGMPSGTILSTHD